MQTLMVKTRDEKGNSAMKRVYIRRSWQDASGMQIYLHANGVYGYKDGSPVRSKSEFDFMGDRGQRERAEKWWDARGRKLSEEFYADLERNLAELSKDVTLPVMGDSDDIDALMYRKRLIKDRRKIAFSPPTTWFEWFAERPAWWGMATVIEIGEFRFELVDADADETDNDDEENADPKRGHMELNPDTKAATTEMADAAGADDPAKPGQKKKASSKPDTF